MPTPRAGLGSSSPALEVLPSDAAEVRGEMLTEVLLDGEPTTGRSPTAESAPAVLCTTARRMEMAKSIEELDIEISTSSTIGGSHPEGNLADAAYNEEEYHPRLGFKGRVWRMTKTQWNNLSMMCESNSNAANPLRAVESAYGSTVLVDTRQRKARSLIGLPVLDPRSRRVMVWTTFVMLVDLIYTAFMVPMSVGFGTDQFNTAFTWIDLCAGLVFIASLVMGFHIGFIAQYNLRRAIVVNGKDVAEYYLKKGTFAIDLVSVVVYLLQIGAFIYVWASPLGSDVLLQGTVNAVVNAVQFLRMVRVYALIGMLKNLLVRAATGSEATRGLLGHSSLYVFIIIYMLAMVINFAACLWFYIGWLSAFRNNPNWLSSVTDGTPEPGCNQVWLNWQGELNEIYLNPECSGVELVNMTFGDSYLVSVYWSVTTMTTVGYGDISANNNAEMVVAMLVMLIGIMMFAVLIGSMQEIFQNASKSARTASVMREKLASVDEWLVSKQLPKSVTSQIKRFYHEAWLQKEEATLENEIFEELPHQLRTIVARASTIDMIRSMDCLRGFNEEHCQLLASKLKPTLVGIGVDICLQGDRADKFWILQEGSMVAMYSGKHCEVEDAPALIGETTLLSSIDPKFETRPCGYRSTTKCRLWELKLKDMDLFATLHPQTWKALRSQVVSHVLTRAGLVDSIGQVEHAVVDQLILEAEQADQIIAKQSCGNLLNSEMMDEPKELVEGVGEVANRTLIQLAATVSGSIQVPDDIHADVPKQSGSDGADVAAVVNEILQQVKSLGERLSAMESR